MIIVEKEKSEHLILYSKGLDLVFYGEKRESNLKRKRRITVTMDRSKKEREHAKKKTEPHDSEGYI